MNDLVTLEKQIIKVQKRVKNVIDINDKAFDYSSSITFRSLVQEQPSLDPVASGRGKSFPSFGEVISSRIEIQVCQIEVGQKSQVFGQ